MIMTITIVIITFVIVITIIDSPINKHTHSRARMPPPSPPLPVPQEITDFWHAADSLALLTESLYEAWVLQPERRRDAESMREAGLGGVGSSAASSQVATAATAVKQSVGDVGQETGNADSGAVLASVEVKGDSGLHCLAGRGETESCDGIHACFVSWRYLT